MSQIPGIVTFREIAALMGAPRLFAIEGAMNDGFGHIKHKAQLERGRQLCIEAALMVIELKVSCAFLKFVQLVSGFDECCAIAIYPAAALHRTLHFLTQLGYALSTVIAVVLLFEPAL